MRKSLINRMIDAIYKLAKRNSDKLVRKWADGLSIIYGLNFKPRNERIVVSLASFAARLDTIEVTLKSLLNQSVKADSIIVVLDDDEPCRAFAEKRTDLKTAGIEFKFDTIGLKPHKKYFYAMQEYPDAVIITVDDDAIYRKNTIKSLMFYHKLFPKAVCARRVHEMTYSSDGTILPYDDWYFERHKIRKPNHDFCATGVGGVLYPAKIMPKEAFDIQNIKCLCLNADDIWLKYMERLADIKVFWVPNAYNEAAAVAGSQNISLCSSNNRGGNNKYIEIMNNYMQSS